MSIVVRIRKLPHGQDLPLPAYQTPAAAGLDLLAAIPRHSQLVIEPGGRVLAPAGVSLELPEGFEAQVRPRSGLALRHGVTVLNSPGTIDADYRGEVCVILVNLGSEPVVIARGDRIAQLVIAPVSRVTLDEVQILSGSARGAGGFGSTGLSAPERSPE